MIDYISKQVATDAVPEELKVDFMDELGAGFNSCRNEMLRTIETLQPADVVQVVHAYWEGEETDCNIKCHKCGKAFRDYIITQDYADLSEYPNFCPNCGAIMDAKEKG